MRYDGHGNVRLLTDSTRVITDRYDYDAFGNIVNHAGSTPNLYLYSGEQNDPNLGLYYLRARNLIVSTGRFTSADAFRGNPQHPLSLHRYIFAYVDPANHLDPSGNDPSLTIAVLTEAVESALLPLESFTPFATSVVNKILTRDPTVVVKDFYNQYTSRLNGAVARVFGKDTSKIPYQTINNAATMDAGYDEAGVGSLCNVPSADGSNNPFLGSHGTVYIAS